MQYNNVTLEINGMTTIERICTKKQLMEIAQA